nr:MAG TPA: hypothetical protein [Caudoviricetes sp.]
MYLAVKRGIKRSVVYKQKPLQVCSLTEVKYLNSQMGKFSDVFPHSAQMRLQR